LKIFRKIPSKWTSRLKVVLRILTLASLGVFAVMYVLKQGIEVGKKVGHCEVACSIVRGAFTSIDGVAACQCQLPSGWIMSIPMNHEFFDSENEDADVILENK